MKTEKNTDGGPLLALELFGNKLSKGQKTQIKIIEGTIKVYSTIGIEQATLDSIGKSSKVSRRLIQHYFGDQQNLFIYVSKYIRGQFQRYVVAAIQSSPTPRHKLHAYIDATFTWTIRYPQYSKVWGLYFYYCGIKEDFKLLNTELVEMGTQRIAALINAGVAVKQFKTDNTYKTSKFIQTILTGALVTIMTEDFKGDEDKFRQGILSLCMGLLKPSD
jgi:AcrR family transcriptional regulator